MKNNIKNNHEFNPHEITWSQEKASRIWDYLSSKKSYHEKNFARLVGEEIINLIKEHDISLRGNALDYGCGPGFFLEKLLEEDICCYGADFSKRSVDLANEKLKGNLLFKGVELINKFPIPFKDSTFDIVFLLEVFEHIPLEYLALTINEFKRITKKEGIIVITTPNDENLEKGKVICPDCGCIYHAGQHISAWTSNSLSNKMSDYNLKKVICQAQTFRVKSILNVFRNIYAKIQKHKKMNLIYIGKNI